MVSCELNLEGPVWFRKWRVGQEHPKSCSLCAKAQRWPEAGDFGNLRELCDQGVEGQLEKPAGTRSCRPLPNWLGELP